MSKDEAIKKIKELAGEHNLFVFVTDKNSVEDFNEKLIDQSEWDRSIKNIAEFGDFSNILEALGNNK